MEKKYTLNMIPEVIAGYNIYDGVDGNQLIGVSGEMSIANLQAMTSEISGAGIAGSYTAPVIGFYQDISQDIPFRTMYVQVAKFMDPMRKLMINVRGLMQVVDRTTGIRDRIPFRYVVGGSATAVNPGSMQLGNPMGSTLTIGATYILLEVGGNVLVEIDKLNQVCVINGNDLLSDIRNYC